MEYSANYGKGFFPPNYFDDICDIYAPPGRGIPDRGNAPAAAFPTGWTVFIADAPCQVIESRQSGTENAQASQVKTAKTYDVNISADYPRPLPSYRVRVKSQNNRDIEITHPVKTTNMHLMKIEGKEIGK
jgi:hypothetical protein